MGDAVKKILHVIANLAPRYAALQGLLGNGGPWLSWGW
jgi:hypothetical protein